MLRDEDLTGRRFGRLAVKERSVNKGKRGESRWLCICDCGNEKVILGVSIFHGRTQSCGCLQRERASQAKTRHGHTSGGVETSEYRSWRAIFNRCLNEKNHAYENYGGRGIAVCDRWRFGENGLSGFECFYADMGPKPTPKHTIDRWPDQNGNYEPTNCRWATQQEQMNNIRGNRRVTIGDRTMTVAEWAREANLSQDVLHDRLKRGWPLDELLSPLRPQKGEGSSKAVLNEGQVFEIIHSPLSGASLARKYGVHTETIGSIRRGVNWRHISRASAPDRDRKVRIGDRSQTVSQWAREANIKATTISRRIKLGWPAERLLEPVEFTVVTIGGRTQTVPEWAKEIGIRPDTLACRVSRGWPPERLLEPVVARGIHAPDGV